MRPCLVTDTLPWLKCFTSQLHCVDLVRKYVHRADYPGYEAFEDLEEAVLARVDHCIDLLRQVVQCTGGVGRVVYDDMGPGKPPPMTRFSNSVKPRRVLSLGC
ncbi:hypothetical protein BO70DRAFT_360809, partial [Aspergillus heteromorphus CBS 117.55]